MREIDPYRQLAGIIVTTQPKLILRDIINGDKKPIVEMLKDECRLIDWCGPIIDTMFADLHSVQDAMWLRQQIEGFANVLMERFDFERLVKNITYICPHIKKT